MGRRHGYNYKKRASSPQFCGTSSNSDSNSFVQGKLASDLNYVY